MKKILLPLAETERSRKSLQFVRRQFTPEEVEIVLMMVDESQTHTARPSVEEAAIRSVEARLEEIRQELEGFKVTTKAATGKAGIKITRAVRETGADFIVMTRSAREDMLGSIGSTTEYVIENAPCHVFIVSESVLDRDEYRGLVYKKASAVVNLRGQLGDKHSECLLPSVNIDCIYHIEVTVGKVRFMHTAYNPDSRSWDIPPLPGQPVSLDISAGETADILVKADSTDGRADRIRIVNRDMKKETMFSYKISAAPFTHD